MTLLRISLFAYYLVYKFAWPLANISLLKAHLTVICYLNDSHDNTTIVLR